MTPTNQSKQTQQREKAPSQYRVDFIMCDRMVNPLGRYCFWHYWTKLCVFDVFKLLHFYLFVNIFFHAFYRIVSCITCIYFWKHTQASRLGGELTIYPRTIGHGSDAWNTQLISKCLLGNGEYMKNSQKKIKIKVKAGLN